MDCVSVILGQQVQGSQSRSSYSYGWSPATRACHSEPESSALHNVEHATKRVRVDIGVDANPFAITEINLDQPCRSGRTRRLFYGHSLMRGGKILDTPYSRRRITEAPGFQPASQPQDQRGRQPQPPAQFCTINAQVTAALAKNINSYCYRGKAERSSYRFSGAYLPHKSGALTFEVGRYRLLPLWLVRLTWDSCPTTARLPSKCPPPICRSFAS